MAKIDRDRGKRQRQLARKRQRSSPAGPLRKDSIPGPSPTSHARELEGLIWRSGTPLGPPKGFSGRGFHLPPGTSYDSEGLNRDGDPKETVEEDGFDQRIKASNPGGSDRLESSEEIGQDTHAAGGIAEGYKADAPSPDQWDDRGFSQDGFHRKTGTGYDPDGFDFQGYDFEGYDRRGYDSLGYDRKGYDREGYDFQGYNRRGSRRRD